MKLDDFDIKILSVLQREGRITKVRLAETIGLSSSPCWERLRRLEAAGYIIGYRAEVNLAKLANLLTVFVEVTLQNHEAADFEMFESAVQDHEEILECYALGGGVDYLFKVVTRDIVEYQALIETLLEAQIGIAKYYTYVVTKPIKSQTPPPLQRLIGSR